MSKVFLILKKRHQNGFDLETNYRIVGYNPYTSRCELMMDKFIGPDFDKGLGNLKSVCEPVQKKTLIDKNINSLRFNFHYIATKSMILRLPLKDEMLRCDEKLKRIIPIQTFPVCRSPLTIKMKGEEIDIERGIPIADFMQETPVKYVSDAFTKFFKSAAVQLLLATTTNSRKIPIQRYNHGLKRIFKLAGPPLEFNKTGSGSCTRVS